MKKFLILFFITSLSFAQDLNDYKYALVPGKFSFLKENDQYRLNTLTKMFMEKYGFETLLSSDILPPEFASDNCNKVFVDVENNSSMFVTKLKVVLKDCKNNVLFISQEGKSKEKEFRVSYAQALREAFNSFDALKHKYNGKVVEKTTEIASKPVENKVEEKVAEINIGEPLFSKPFGESSFQLLTNNTAIPRLALTISKTSVADVYIATRNTTTGVLVKKNNQWFFEYYLNNQLKSESVTIVNFN